MLLFRGRRGYSGVSVHYIFSVEGIMHIVGSGQGIIVCETSGIKSLFVEQRHETEGSLVRIRWLELLLFGGVPPKVQKNPFLGERKNEMVENKEGQRRKK